jgi:hypothetical protein
MKSIRIFLTSCCLLVGATGIIEASEWNGIRPLHSSRSDVEGMLGPSVRACKTLWCFYKLPRENVFIQYASGPPCGTEIESAWQVPRDTVVNIEVYYPDERLLSDLKLDLSKFVKTVDTHLIGWIYYLDGNDGIQIAGSGPSDPAEMKLVRSITYFAEAKDEALRCSQRRAEQALGADSLRAGFFLR